MKKLFLIGALAMLFACAKDEANVGSTTQPEGISLYGLKQLEGTGTRGVALKDRMWKTGETIRIKFLNGTETQKSKVQEFAAEWLQYANLVFDYVAANETADVKISFDWQGDKVTWSYVGTEARTAPQSQPSTNFGKLSSVDKLMKRDILMEFGHILGLVNEHQGPECPIQWDVETVYAYYLEAGWKSKEVTDFFFRPYSAAEVNYTVFDPKSIMVWPIDDILTLDGTAYPRNSELSATDKQFIAELYPSIQTEPTILTFEFNSSTYQDFRTLKFSEMLLTDDDVVIDFGNGGRYEGPAPQAPSVTYGDGVYEVKIWAKEMNLQAKGSSWYFPLIKCYLSSDTEYTGLSFYRSDLREISYSQPPNFGGITSFAGAFAYSKLEVIPEDIFYKGILATSFSQTFSNCENLKLIPEKLFEKNVLAGNFYQVFCGCKIRSIPQGLFEKNSQAYFFTGAFAQCSALTEIPKGLFANNPKITRFNATFAGCSSLISVPQGLFDNNPVVEDFTEVFSSCVNLTEVPIDLFDQQDFVSTFHAAFCWCRNLKYAIPLWVKFPYSVWNDYCYLGCTNVSNWADIPAGWK